MKYLIKYTIGLVLRLLVLLTCVLLISCARGPEKTRKKLEEFRKYHPELFEEKVRIDTIRDTITYQIPSKPLDVGEIDSLLEEYCTPDTIERVVVQERIKEQIRNRCKLSSLLPIETIHKFEQGQVKIRVNDREELTVDLEVYQTNTFKEVTTPCPEPPTFWDHFLALWPLIAILVLIIIAQNVLRK